MAHLKTSSNRVCRTCLSSEELRPLFPENDDYYKFERALFLSTGCKITSSDGLPQKICKKCVIFVQSFMQFRIRSKRANKKLLNSLKNTTKPLVPPKNVAYDAGEKTCMIERVDINPHKTECDKTIKFECEIKAESDEDDEKFLSTVRTKARQHNTADEKKIVKNDCILSERLTACDKTIKFECEIKAESDEEDERFLSTVRTIERQHNTADEKNLVKNEHCIQSERLTTNSNTKKVNSDDYNDDDDYHLHSRTSENSIDVSPLSLNKFEDEKSSSKHRYLDLIEGPPDKIPITCNICKKQFRLKNAFILHTKSHLGYDLLCEFCARQCQSLANLKRHLRAKHGFDRDNSFACSFCNIQLLDKEQLESHERRIHTKERPFVCNECGEAFYTRKVLNQHGLTHKSERLHQCDFCPGQFKTLARLNFHKKTVHQKKFPYIYGCYICRKNYQKTTSARKHILKIHGVPKEEQGKLLRFNVADKQNNV